MDEYKQKIERLEKDLMERKNDGQRRLSVKIIDIPRDQTAVNNQLQSKFQESSAILNTLKLDLQVKEKTLEEANAALEAKRIKCKNYKTSLQAREVSLKKKILYEPQ